MRIVLLTGLTVVVHLDYEIVDIVAIGETIGILGERGVVRIPVVIV